MSERRDNTTRIEKDVMTENKADLKHLLRLWKYVFSSAKWMCLIFMGLTVLLSLLRPVLAFIWSQYVDGANRYTEGAGLLPMLSLAIAYFVIQFLSDMIFRYTDSMEDIERFDIVQSNRFKEMLDSRIYQKISRLSAEYTDIPKINDTIAKVLQFTSDAWHGLSRTIMRPGYFIVAKLVSVLSIGASLYLINPWLCVILVIAPLPTLYTTYVGDKLQFQFVKENVGLQREMNYFQELVMKKAVKEIKVMNLFDFFYGKWKSRTDEYTIKENKIYVKRMLLGTVSNLISSFSNIAANVLAIVLFTQGTISLGALGAVMSLTGTLISDTSALFSSAAAFLSKKNEAGMFFDLMDLPDEKAEGEKVEEMESIRAEELSYRYPLTEKYVLENVSLTIEKGEKIAFVGENGAGKTTLVKLLSGLAEPSGGKLLVNGRDSGILDAGNRYDGMSTVTQEPARYTTFTAADNVFLGDTAREREEKEIEKALHFSGLTEVVPDTLLGKDIGGTDLSGGQWQKLAIARSAYRGRDFMILDEPTGNLDPIAEAEVFKKYLELAKDKTVIFVTHRISVAALAERIIVFSQGKVVEDGTHDALMKQNGEYARLYNAQAKWYDR